MLLTEYGYETDIRVKSQEAREEGKAEGLAEGVEKGVDVSTEIVRALIEKTPIEEIAARFKVSIEKVKQMQDALAMLPS